MKQKLLLTGGSGYIGSHTLLELAKTGRFELAVFDNFKNGHREAIERVSEATGENIEIYEGDLLDEERISSVLKGADFFGVIHFAALIEAGISMSEPTRFFENNISGTINLVKAMQAASTRKLVFSSTAAVYGTPENPLVTEESKIQPENWYGFSKYASEQLFSALAQEFTRDSERIDSVILRYFNAAGADPDLLLGQDYPRPTHLITVAIEAALGRRDKLTVFGGDYPTRDGSCERDFIHVGDLATAHVAALDFISEHSGSEVFNIGTGHGTTNLEVIKEIENIHGEFDWEIGPRRPGDAAGYYADTTKARERLNWQPKYDLPEIISHSYAWHKNNPDGYGVSSETTGDNSQGVDSSNH